MKAQNFIQFDSNNSTVKLTLRFHVTETTNVHFEPKCKLTMNTLDEILCEALHQRMQHCQDILTTLILPAEDKVFTPYMIFSNSVGKHFSIKAYEAMENVLSSLDSFKENGERALQNFIQQLTRLEAQQCLKALASMEHNSVEPELFSEVVNAVAEALLVNPISD